MVWHIITVRQRREQNANDLINVDTALYYIKPRETAVLTLIGETKARESSRLRSATPSVPLSPSLNARASRCRPQSIFGHCVFGRLKFVHWRLSLAATVVSQWRPQLFLVSLVFAKLDFSLDFCHFLAEICSRWFLALLQFPQRTLFMFV